MPVDNKGNFRLHPGAVNMHNAAPPIASKKGEVSGKKTADPGEQEGPKGHVELHAGPHAEKAPGAKFHTIHHPSGEVKGHETLHDAHHAMNEHMGEDGCKGTGNCEHASEAEPSNDIGEADAGGADEY